MPVSDSTSVPPPSRDQRKAAAALLRTFTPGAAELGELFARAGHELALVGGSVRDVFLGGRPEGDLDMTTDAVPERVLAITRKWPTRRGRWESISAPSACARATTSSRSPPTAAS